jgi:1-deoxy-D-xylulose-5-phosphate synthase
MDRAGLAGPDGPTHHGVFDIGYLRMFPHMIAMAPGDALDVAPMLEFALAQTSPTSLRYPKANAEEIERDVAPIELGRAEVIQWGVDGTILCCGALLGEAIGAAQLLKEECGLDVGVVNARFIKPLDREVLRRALSETAFVVTVEEGVLMTGFGSAVLEAAGEMNLDTRRVRRLGIPDAYVQHAERSELLAELGLDARGICVVCRELSEGTGSYLPTDATSKTT